MTLASRTNGFGLGLKDYWLVAWALKMLAFNPEVLEVGLKQCHMECIHHKTLSGFCIV